MGGKATLFHELLPYFRKNDFDIFVDVFGGSGIVSLKIMDQYKNQLTKPSKIIYNDIAFDVFNVFDIISKDIDEVIKTIELLLFHESFFKEQIENKNKDGIIMQALTILKYVISIGGIGKNIGYSYYINNGKLSIRTSKIIRVANNLLKIKPLFNNYLFKQENLDYKIILQKYDSEKTLFYLDPPYIQTAKYYNYSIDSYEKLCKNIIELKGKVIISDYENEIYDNFLVKKYNWKKYIVNNNRRITLRLGKKDIRRKEYIWCKE